MSSRAGHVTTETVFRQTLALQLGDGDEHRALESDRTGLKVKGNLSLYKTAKMPQIFEEDLRKEPKQTSMSRQHLLTCLDCYCSLEVVLKSTASHVLCFESTQS